MQHLVAIAEVILFLAGAAVTAIVTLLFLCSAVVGVYCWVEDHMGWNQYRNPLYKVRRDNEKATRRVRRRRLLA